MPDPLKIAAETAYFVAGRSVLYWMAANVATGAAYFALGAVGSAFFAAYGLFPAPICLPAAVAMVAAIAGEVRLFPGIFAGSLITNAVLFAPPPQVTAIISLTDALGPVAAAIALRHMRPAKGVFTSFVGVMRFLLCTTLLSPAISAAGGTIALSIGHRFDWLESYAVWLRWWLYDAGGTLYLAPALLLWLRLEDGGGATDDRRLSRPSLTVWGGVAAFSAILFLTPPLPGSALHPVLPFLLVVPLSWIALRMSLRAACTLILVIAVIAAAGSAAGLGAFDDPGIPNPLGMVGVLVVLLAMVVLTTVSLVAELHAAESASRVKSMFLATTSHELRNPLNAILGFSSMIDSQAMGPIENAKYTDYARMIHHAGEHLLGLLNGLLDLSKIEAGQFTLAEERIVLAQAIEEAFDLVRIGAEAKGIELSCDVAPAVEALVGDRQALRQILLNLLGNAVKFTPSGGHVAVSAQRGPKGEVTLLVRDTGIGIPPDRLERVFAPFERGPQSEAAELEGAGLGLSITRGLIDLLGGTIRLESEVGRGTTAIVTLPASRLLAPGQAAPVNLAAAAG